MYKAYLNNQIFFDTDSEDYSLALTEARLSLKAGSSGSFVFTIPPQNTAYGTFHKLTDYVDVYDDDRLIFSGRVFSIEMVFNTQYRITCEGMLAVLNDSIFRPFTFDGELHTLVRNIITSHNDQVEQDKQIEIGRLLVSNTDVYRAYEKYDTSISRLHDLVDSFGGWIRIRKENGTLYFDWYDGYIDGTSQSIDFGENLLDIKQSQTSDGIITVLIPLGAIDDLGNRLNITSVNSGLDYLEASQEYIQKYGYVVGTNIWEDVETASELKTKGQQWLNACLTPKITINVTAVDLADAGYDIDNFAVGQRIKVTSAPHDLDGEWFDCQEQNLDLLNLANNRLSLGTEVLRYTKTARSLSGEMQSSIERIAKTYAPKSMIETAIDEATSMITGNSGGYVVIHDSDNDGKPDEILVMDTPNIDTAVKVWRWNNSGLGYSSTGYDGTYGLAMTINGAIVADYITTGTLSAERVKAGILRGITGSSYWNLETGELYVHGYATSESVNTLVQNLQSQIDGNIQSWSGTPAPTLQNYPASQWDTNDKRLSHVGDIYYDGNGKCYRFAQDGNTFKWVLITDTEISKALSDAAEALEGVADINGLLITDYYTKTETDSEITASEGRISSTISATYSTKVEAQGYASTAQSNAISTAASDATSKANAAQSAAEATAAADATSKANTAENNAKGYTDTQLVSYSTTTEMNSAITQKANEITSSVASTYATQTALGDVASATITGSTMHYLATSASSGVTRSTSGWTTSVQNVTSTNRYLWTYITYTYGDSHTTDTDPVISGVYGNTGDKGDKGDAGTGVTITSKSVTYKEGTSGTTAPTGTWSTSVPTVATGNFLWTKTVVNYSDGTSTTSYSVSYMGTNGTNGVSPTVSSTVVEYQQSTSGTTVPTGTWSTTPPSSIAGSYMWTRTTVTYSDGATTVSYSVGKNGTDGINGTDGDDGISVTSVVPIWYASASNSAPEQPTSAVTSTSTSGGAWRVVLPTLTTSYPYLYTCNQVAYSNGSYSWSTVTYDSANAAIVNLEDRVTTAEQKITDTAIVNTVMTSDTFANVYVLDNLLSYPYYYSGSRTISGVTFTVNSDGTITANGTATAQADYTIKHRTNSNFGLPAGQYILSGCASGGSSSTHAIILNHTVNGAASVIGRDYGEGLVFTSSSGTDYYGVIIRIISGKTVNNLVFKPMIERGSIAHDYISYADSRANNQVVTDIEARVSSAELKITDSAIVSTVMDSERYTKSAAVVNLLPRVYYREYQSISTDSPTWTNGGITWSMNTDGSVVANGTATADTNFTITSNTTSAQVPLLHLDTNKTYTLSGCPSGGSTTKYYISLHEMNANETNVTTHYDIGQGITFTPTNPYAYVRLRVNSGQTVSNLTFYPMLEISETKNKYVSTHTDGALATRMKSAESSITQNANNIALKVSQTDYNGNTIASLINQSATTVAISASKINLQGYVTATDLGSTGSTVVNGSRIYGGTINLGGSGNGNGLIHVYDTNGNFILGIGNTGLYTQGNYGLTVNVEKPNQYGIYCNGGLSIQTTGYFGGNVSCNAALTVAKTISTGTSASDVGTVTIKYGGLNVNNSGTYASGQNGIYCKGDIYAQGTISQGSDRNLKKNIKTLDGTTAEGFINSLLPSEYNLIEGDAKKHHGFIAQDVEAVLNRIYGRDWGVVISPDSANGTDNRRYKSIVYTELLADIVAVLQLHSSKIKELEKEA